MIRVRFALAAPRNGRPAQLPARVPSPGLVRSDRATLWVDEKTPCRALGDQGLALGILFGRTTFRPIDQAKLRIPPAVTLEAIAQHLLKECWGAYVAIVKDPGNGSLAVLVDPSGLLPVYRCDGPDHVVLSTDPALIEARPSYTDIASHLLRPELRHRRTCLAGVDELPPGSIVGLDRPQDAPRQLWRPTDHFPSGPAPRFDDAAETLRELAGKVLGSWADLFGRTGVAASGGVDSSLVCAALSHAGAHFDCITVSTADASGDERQHAGLVAKQFGVKCLEREFDPALFDPGETASLGLPRPARRAFLKVFDRLLDDAREELGAGVVLDGNNGDNLFCYLHSAAPIADRLRAEGLGVGILETLLDMCRITDCSIPTMVAATARRLGTGISKDPWPPDGSLLAHDVAHAGRAPLTPWLDDGPGGRSGKHDHLRLLMHAQNHLHGIAGSLPRFSPLASQPLVELCLSLPSWLWTNGGKNRALTRAAFADRLPRAIIARTSKSGPDSFIRIAFARNRAQIRERLLDGLLASHGVLDLPALDRALQVDEFKDDLVVDRIFDILEAENWARSWSR